jgi:hypothetical protein
MRRNFSSRRFLGSSLAVLAALVAVLSGVFALHASAASSATLHSSPWSVNPQMQPAGTPTSAVFGCQTNRGPNAIVCYSPQ